MSTKNPTTTKTSAVKSTILYLHVDADTKTWLKDLCAKQTGHVSLSTMAKRIFAKAKKEFKLSQVA